MHSSIIEIPITGSGTSAVGNSFSATTAIENSTVILGAVLTASYAVTAAYAVTGGDGGGGGTTLTTGSSYPITSSYAVESKYIRSITPPPSAGGVVYFDDILLPQAGGGYIGESGNPIVQLDTQFANVGQLGLDYISPNNTNIGVWCDLVMDGNNPSPGTTHKLVGTASYADKSLTVEKITQISSSNGDTIELHNSMEPAAGKTIDIGNFGATNPISSVQATSVYCETVYTDAFDILNASVITANAPIVGTLQGTASYAITSSYALNGGGTGGGGTTLITGSTYPITASWANNLYITSSNQTTGSYILVSNDNGKVITFQNATTNSIVIPSGLPTNFNVFLVSTSTGSVLVTGSGVQLNNANNCFKLSGRYSAASVVSYLPNSYILFGDVSL